MNYFRNKWEQSLQKPTVKGMYECPFCGELLPAMAVKLYRDTSASSCAKCSNPYAELRHRQGQKQNLGLAEDTAYEEDDTGFDLVPPLAAHFDHAAKHEELRGLKRKKYHRA